jgi:hypothetical protein
MSGNGEPEKYLVGDATMQNVFRPYGLTNLHDMQAVLDAVEKALSSQPAQTWQPIETAPQDGSRIILMWEPFSGMSEHVELGKWSIRNAWVNTYGQAFSGSPTHWTPLPTPTKNGDQRP